MQEVELVSQIKAGNSAAFASLIEEYQKKVYSVAYGIVRNPEDAMDIAQETFIRVWDRIGTWRGDAALSTWICRVASNLALDFLRKNKRVVPVEDIEYGRDVVQPSVEADVLNAEAKTELDRAVSQLPEEYRQLVVLRHTGDMSYQDMADLLGLSLSQVKNRLLRARQMLRERLKGRVG